MNDFDCCRKRLAGATGLFVDQCSCGCVHVTIGAVTLRLRPETVVEVGCVLQEAVTELERRRVAPSEPFASMLLS